MMTMVVVFDNLLLYVCSMFGEVVRPKEGHYLHDSDDEDDDDYC